MKRTMLFLLPAVLIGFVSPLHALTVCGTTGIPCVDPSFNAITSSGWGITITQVNNMQALNSGSSDGNEQFSNYYFALTTTDRGASAANGSIVSDLAAGTTVIGPSVQNFSSDPASTVTGGFVTPTKGASAYYAYAQACPNGAGVNTLQCSRWVKIKSNTTTTLAYPSNPFAVPVQGAIGVADVTTGGIRVRTSIGSTDASTISRASITVTDVDNGFTVIGINQGGVSGAPPQVYPFLTSVQYNPDGNGFRPNTYYRYKGQVNFPYATLAPAAGQTVFPLWTAPLDPANVSVGSNFSHCAATITFQNAASAFSGVLGNPSSSPYTGCLGAACATKTIGGTGRFNDTNTVYITGLSPNTSYTPRVQAENRGASNWPDSANISGPPITTLAWGGSFTVLNVFYTSATLRISGVDVTGLASWDLRLNGSTVLTGDSSNINQDHTVTGLTPNTLYTPTIILREAGCPSSPLPFTPSSFTTTPYAPTSGSFSNVLATSLQVNWVDGSANPNGSTYEVNLCLDAAFTTGCQTATVAKPTFSLTFTVSPTTTYYARVRTRNISRPTWPDSAFLIIGFVTTPPNMSAITVAPNPGSAVTGTPLTFTATVTDESGAVIPGATVTWLYSGGAGQISTTSGASTILTATVAGSFTLTASRSGYTSVIVPVTVSNSGPVVTSAELTLNPDHVTGNLSCTATDPGYPEPSLIYTWSLESGPAAVSYSANGTNAAKNSIVTFTRAGSYSFRCTVTDPASISGSGVTATRDLAQFLTAIQVCPAGSTSCPSSVTIKASEDQQFVANGMDQFGQSMPPLSGVVWTVTSGGSISAAGVFRSGEIGTSQTVTATASGISGSILVTSVSYDVTNAKAYPVPYKASQGRGTITFANLGSEASIHIYSTSGRLVFETRVSADTYDWDVKNTSGESIASGVYFYVIESPESKKNGKLIIIK